MNGVELLAPAGNWEAFEAAIENGADAVYIGGKSFSARALAANFNDSEIKDAVRYAHIRGKKVFLAMNTLIFENELQKALEVAAKAYEYGVDALILQDIGFSSAINSFIPDLRLHASTQMTIYDTEGINILKKMGFNRVVLARELSIEEIREIVDVARKLDIEVEVFAHGALCISYSGQCLMSSFIGGRSGNRGCCAQPCRLRYKLACTKDNSHHESRAALEKSPLSSYIMSPKDICALDILPQLINSGVTSLKIEGRMKSPEYVAVVTSIYRKYIDKIINLHNISQNQYVTGTANDLYKVDDEDRYRLFQIFNRGGFSKGYLEGKKSYSMMCFEKPKNWGIFLGTVVGLCKGTYRIKVKLDDDIEIGDGIEVWTGDNEDPSVVVTYIREKDKAVKSAQKGQIVEIGDIKDKSKIREGQKIYKTSSKKLLKEARLSFERCTAQCVPLKAHAILVRNKPATLIVSDYDGNEEIILSNAYPQDADAKPVTKTMIESWVRKTGGTPYFIKSFTAEIGEGLTIPALVINGMRRDALAKIDEKRARVIRANVSIPSVNCLSDIILPQKTEKNNTVEKPAISIFVNTISKAFDDLGNSLVQADAIYIPFGEIVKGNNLNLLEKARNRGANICVHIPVVAKNDYISLLKKYLPILRNKGFVKISVGNISTLEFVSTIGGFEIFCDYSFNAVNSLTVLSLISKGACSVCVSPEAKHEQLQGLMRVANYCEYIVYGKIPLMTTEYCPVNAVMFYQKSNDCRKYCFGKEHYLIDEKGRKFKIVKDPLSCRNMILSNKPLDFVDDIESMKLERFKSLKLMFWEEDLIKMNDIILKARRVFMNER